MAVPAPHIGKDNVVCPHCGFQQLESAFARTTICRKCSQHYTIVRPGEKPEAAPAEKGWLLTKVGALVKRETTRQVRCFSCGAGQTVSSSAKSSICPACASYIDLRDFKISTLFSRTVETQGVITITAKGEVTSAKLACSEAWLYGNLRGNLLSTGTTHVKLKGKVLGALDAHHLIVEKGANVEFVRPVKVGSAEIFGRVSARLMAEGVVAIRKTGAVEGAVFSKGITVDKGGLFSGELSIGRQEAEQSELLGESGGLFGGELALGQA